MRSVFGALTRANVNLSVPLQIVAFRSSKEMLQITPIFNGKATTSAGLFETGEDRSFIIVDMSVNDPWRTVFHEYAHRLMEGNFSFRADPWFEEGFAEYFSSIEVGKKKAHVGKIPEQTYQILRQTGMMGVSELFRVQKTSPTYNEDGEHRTAFYAQAGLVVHYLYDHHLVPKVAVYFDTLRLQKKPVEQAIRLAFAMTAEQFDEALGNYLNGGRYSYYPVRTASRIASAQFTVRPMSDADAHAVVADLHAHSPYYRDKALAEFQDVLKTDPENAAALRGTGFVYLQQRDYERAADYLRRAARRDSKDARVHFYYAVLLNQQGAPDVEMSEEIKKELELAIALDPSLADAYSLLGFAQASSGEPEKGIATLKKALELSPRNERYMFNLASAYITDGKVDEAISTLQTLAASADPEIATRARQALEQAIDFKTQSAALQLPRSSATQESPKAEPKPEQDKSVPGPGGEAEGAMYFMKGKLIGVDCSAAPQAVLTVALGTKSRRVHVRDVAKMVLIGADRFSCNWTNRTVAVNYHERADGDGEVVSLEMQ